MTAHSAFAALTTFDPELARSLAAARRKNAPALPAATLADMVETIFFAYQRELHLGAAVAEGYRKLLEDGTPRSMRLFGREIRQAANRSAALGHHLAKILPPVLRVRNDALLASFRKTLAILLSKGDYLVKAPLEGLAQLAARDEDACLAYLTLLQAAFNRPLSYNRCQYLGNLLPRAVMEFPVSQRSTLIRQMTRIASDDLDLIEPYLEGLSHGLGLLSGQALQRFVDRVLGDVRRDPQAARRFLALRSSVGREACRSLQTAATLAGSLARLNRYIAARTGQTGCIRSLSAIRALPDNPMAQGIQSGTDGVHLYLPDVVDCLPTRADNDRLLQVMARFEAGLIEFDTFAFDIERARDMGCLRGLGPGIEYPPDSSASDFTVFSRHFEDPRLALDLFTLFEHARIRIRLARAYPGLVRSGLHLYQDAMQARLETSARGNLLEACYGILALDLPAARMLPQNAPWCGLVRDIAAAFAARGPETMCVEHCAGLVVENYDRFHEALSTEGPEARLLIPPYRMPLLAELIDAAGREARQQAYRLAEGLKTSGVKLYRGDLRQLLQRTAGRPNAEELLQLAGKTSTDGVSDLSDARQLIRLSEDVLDHTPGAGDIEDPGDVDRIAWFREWNAAIGDYLLDHVRVRDRRLAGVNAELFTGVLERCEDLVRRIRRSFELLRPEGLGLLRQWIEGDDFDYRALLDFAIDRKAGILPSDRLYIKRVKQCRDVAVLLLVDLSRSTSNIVEESNRSVLDVAKEAIVLFTQALEVVGDAYAIAGFSGTGRLGVDYFRIKDFDEPLSASVKATIGALTPQRGTRMGAAIRRAAMDLATRETRVRLLLVIGDGFPNDTDYKGAYAVQDTRQAIAEARSSGIITQAITVNLPASPQLDELYGPVRHTVISRVDELPDKLWRLYGTLTHA